MPSVRRFSARGSPPWRASLRLTSAFSSGLGQGDQGEAAEPELTAAASDDEALNPTAGSGRLDKEVEAIAVSVSSWRSEAKERGREGLLGMAAGGLRPG